MVDIFISYANEDKLRARKVANALEASGWSVWWDRKIIAGQTFDEVIERELEAAKSVVVLWSKNSVSSEWVKNEASVAADRGVLVPALIDKVKLPLAFRRKQTVNLVGWYGGLPDERFNLLCDGVEASVTGEAPQPRPMPSFEPMIWITRIIVSLFLFLIVWLIKNSYFYYEHWFNFNNFKDFLSLNNIAKIVSILTAFGILKNISLIEFINKYFFFKLGYKSLKVTLPLFIILSTIIISIISINTPYLNINKIDKPIKEYETNDNFTMNLKNYNDGLVQPEKGYLSIDLNTKNNTLKNYKLTLWFEPDDKILFAQILTHKNFGFDRVYSNILSGKNLKSDLFENDKNLKGKTKIILRWKIAYGSEKIKNSIVKVNLQVGEWSREYKKDLYDK